MPSNQRVGSFKEDNAAWPQLHVEWKWHKTACAAQTTAGKEARGVIMERSPREIQPL